MTAGESTPGAATGPGPTASQDPQELTREIERTRQQLGETVEALAAKADVKARATDKMKQTRARLQDTGKRAGKLARQRLQDTGKQAGGLARQRPLPLAAVTVLPPVAALLLVIWWRRR